VSAPPDIRFQADAVLTPAEVNGAYAWVEWPARDAWRIDAASRSCVWFAARDVNGALAGISRLLDDGGLHAALWDVIVHPERRRQGIGRALVRMALDRAADRRLVAIVSTPAAVPFFAALGFVNESHGHQAMYVRPAAGSTAEDH
jgi:GNAT superfamily N-acetyltransferase